MTTRYTVEARWPEEMGWHIISLPGDNLKRANEEADRARDNGSVVAVRVVLHQVIYEWAAAD